jgi:integrase-like protein
MPPKLEKIDKHPGIFKRGSRYVAFYYDAAGKQRKKAFRTLTEAAKFKRAAAATDRDRGELDPRSTLLFEEYAREWVDSYQGRGRRGFRESTRDDYRRALERYAYVFLNGKLLTAITPRDVNQFVGWLCDEKAQHRRLSDSTVRNVVAPVRSCLATAAEDGMVRHNPAVRVRLPNRPRVVEDDGQDVRALTREQLDTILRLVRPEWRGVLRAARRHGAPLQRSDRLAVA